MAKISVCDVCLSEKKYTESRYRVGFTGSVKVDVCVEHQNHLKGKNRDEFVKEYLRLEQGRYGEIPTATIINHL